MEVCPEFTHAGHPNLPSPSLEKGFPSPSNALKRSGSAMSAFSNLSRPSS